MKSTEEPPAVETIPLPRTRTYTRLMKRVSRVPPTGPVKVSVVGAGRVGSATAFALISMGLCTDMALVDVNKDIVDGEKLDMLHGQAFLGRRCVIEAGSDFIITKVESCVAIIMMMMMMMIIIIIIIIIIITRQRFNSILLRESFVCNPDK